MLSVVAVARPRCFQRVVMMRMTTNQQHRFLLWSNSPFSTKRGTYCGSRSEIGRTAMNKCVIQVLRPFGCTCTSVGLVRVTCVPVSACARIVTTLAREYMCGVGLAEEPIRQFGLLGVSLFFFAFLPTHSLVDVTDRSSR